MLVLFLSDEFVAVVELIVEVNLEFLDRLGTGGGRSVLIVVIFLLFKSSFSSSVDLKPFCKLASSK